MNPIPNRLHLQHITSINKWLFLAAIILLVGCTPGKETVTFMVFGDPSERQAYLDLVAAFQEAHPEIEVEMTHIPSPREYRTRLATEFAAGDPPNVTLMNYRRYGAFIANGLLEPVEPYLSASELIQPEDFYPITIKAFTWDGVITCIPQNISSLVVYYNQNLFDAAGIPTPSDDWTWDDFVKTAVTLTQDFDGDGRIDQYGLGVTPSLYRLAPFVWQNNAPIVDSQTSPTRLTLTRPPSQEAVQWFVNLRQLHGVVPNRIEEAALDSESRFVAGTTAMYLNSRRGTPTYREIASFIWNAAPLPQNKSAAGVLHSDAYCLSSTTNNKDAAWTFIEFANSPTGQSIIAGSGRTVPSLTAVAESDAFLNPNQLPAHSRVWLDTIPTLQLVPLISSWEEIEGTASDELERAFYGDISVNEAVLLIDGRTEEYFRLGISR